MLFKLQIFLYLIRIEWENLWYKNKLEKLRNKKFRSFKKRLSASAFYTHFSGSNSQLRDFPIMDKSSFMENFDAINTVGISKNEAMDLALSAESDRDFSSTIRGITIGLSTGTSGNRGVFMASQKERALWVAYILNRVIGLSYLKRKVAFFLRANSNLYESVRSHLLEFSFFDLMLPMEENIKRLISINPEILVAPPSVLLEIANAIEQEEIVLTPQKVISVAEVLYPEDKVYLERIFNQTIHQVYQCTEGFLGYTCKHGTLHLNEDFLIIEKRYLDEERTRFHPIITDLHRRSQPIIRYELNDILLEKKSCSCGSKMMALQAIEGRSDDILVFQNELGKEVQIFPDFFRRAIVLASEHISDYIVIQNNQLELSLFVEGESDLDFEKAKEAIQDLLLTRMIDGVAIQKISKPVLKKGMKMRRIRNECHTSV